MAGNLEIIGDKEYSTKELMKVLALKHRPIFSTIFIYFAAPIVVERQNG